MKKISISLIVASLFVSSLMAVQSQVVSPKPKVKMESIQDVIRKSKNMPLPTQLPQVKKVKKFPYVENIKGQVDIMKFRKKFSKDNLLFKNPMLQIVKVFDVSSELYYIEGTQMVDMRRYGKSGFKMNPIQLYMTKTGQTLITGNVMDKTGKPITKHIDLAPNKDLAAFTVGSGKTAVYVFTDPDCPYCEQFEKMFPKLKSDYKLYVYFFPLTQIHPNSKHKSGYILMQPKEKRWDTLKAIQGHNNPSKVWDVKISPKAKHLLSDMIKYGNEYVGVRGTPTVMDKNGKNVNRMMIFKK